MLINLTGLVKNEQLADEARSANGNCQHTQRRSEPHLKKWRASEHRFTGYFIQKVPGVGVWPASWHLPLLDVG
jgi:hypothetical protein